MKIKVRHILCLLATAILTLSFTACNDGGSDDKAGPASAASFAGSSVSFNPTVNFLAGNNLTYINTEAGSPFPAAAVATNGTYTYAPNANFTIGTLTLTVDGIPDPIVLELSGFRVSNNKVTGFTVRSGGRNYPVTVTGTINAYTKPGGGNAAGETSADDIPASMRGTYHLTFFQEESGAGVPADGTQTTFTINARTLVFNGRTLSNPVFYQGNEYEWLFKDGNITYAASISNTGGLNEINIYGPVGVPGFFGQYREAAEITLTDGRPASGTYTAKVNFIDPSTATDYPVGTSKTFVFGNDTLDFDGETYAFVDANEFTANYMATIEGTGVVIRVGLAEAAGQSYVSYFNVERIGTTYFFRVVPVAP